MTIKEMEERSGMERANIRFYEKEGLLFPKRLENGYRDYSEEDLRTLLKIKLLRNLHISLEEIKSVQEGADTLVNVLERQQEQSEEKKERVFLCRRALWQDAAGRGNIFQSGCGKIFRGMEKTTGTGS